MNIGYEVQVLLNPNNLIHVIILTQLSALNAQYRTDPTSYLHTNGKLNMNWQFKTKSKKP